MDRNHLYLAIGQKWVKLRIDREAFQFGFCEDVSYVHDFFNG